MKNTSRNHPTGNLNWIDGQSWASRSESWLKADFTPAKTKITPRRNHIPLIITGYGAGLSVRNGTLVVRDGYSHFPAKRAEYRFFPRDANLPSRIVILDGSGTLSFDAMEWLSLQNVPLIRINWRGEVQYVVGKLGYSADPKRVSTQREAKASGRSLDISINLIRTKIANSILTLRECLPPSQRLHPSLQKLGQIVRELSSNPPKTISSLLGVEGNAAIAYFDAWQTIPIKWKGVGRRPIPNDWNQVGPRSSVVKRKIGNRNATHPVNAMLNYGYAILESQVQSAIIAEGLDPTISVLHIEKSGRSALVFDLMEPLRPLVDRAILLFIQVRTFYPADFTIRPDGVCRLNPQLAKELVRLAATQIPNINYRLLAGS